MYFFSDLEPVSCSMSSSNCCFLTCKQVSQEAGQWLSTHTAVLRLKPKPWSPNAAPIPPHCIAYPMWTRITFFGVWEQQKLWHYSYFLWGMRSWEGPVTRTLDNMREEILIVTVRSNRLRFLFNRIWGEIQPLLGYDLCQCFSIKAPLMF